MTEQERIHALLQDGRISQEEADLLLEALDEADAAEAEADAFVTDGVTPPEAATPPDPPHAPAPPQPGASPTQGQSGLRWLTISLMAKNVEIQVDESLSEPRVEGARLEGSGSGWQVEAQSLESLLSSGKIDIRLPPNTAVDLSTKAGNVEVEDVPFFRGRVAAGNVELKRVRGVDLELKAGNLDAELLLTEGEHRVQIAMGNADVEILRGSSVRVRGRASMGRVEMPGPARLGGGQASLDLLVKMGNLDVKVPRE